MIETESARPKRPGPSIFACFCRGRRNVACPPIRTTWYVARSDRTADLVLPYVSKTDAYWRYYEDWYDAIVLNALAEKGENQKVDRTCVAGWRSRPRQPRKKVTSVWLRGRAYAQNGPV